VATILKHKEIFDSGCSFHFANSSFKTNDKFAFHSHDFYEFTVVEKGILRQIINGEKKDLGVNSVCLIKPADVHSVSVTPESKEVRIFNLAVTVEMFEKAVAFLCIDAGDIGFSTKLPPDKHIDLMSKLEALKVNYQLHNRRYLEIYVKELVVNMLVLLLKQNDAKPGLVPAWLKHACEQMQKSENYIQGLRQFVHLSGKSQEHLTRSIKKYYGITPTVFINQQRLKHAASMLSATNESVTEIMYASGFENVSHFLRLFKKQYNLTPSRYRQKNKNIYNPGRQVQ